MKRETCQDKTICLSEFYQMCAEKHEAWITSPGLHHQDYVTRITSPGLRHQDYADVSSVGLSHKMQDQRELNKAVQYPLIYTSE